MKYLIHQSKRIFIYSSPSFIYQISLKNYRMCVLKRGIRMNENTIFLLEKFKMWTMMNF